jgi:Tol biopolymer transport system component
VPQLFISSTRDDRNPSYSSNGKEIGFLSTRSGSTQIWIADAAGTEALQLTSVDSAPFFPQWSPNGQRFLFHSRIGGQPADLFSISVNGGHIKRLTSDPSEDYLASYSRDGNWIYFTSERSGVSEIWKMPADGGEPTRLTLTGGAFQPIESPDGKNLFYAKGGSELTIWKIPSAGGTAKQVTGPIAKDPAFAVSVDGIYYKIPAESPSRQVIQFLSFSTGQSRPVVVTEHEIGQGLSLSPDERYLIFAQRQPGSDLMLIKDFVAP